MKKFCKLFFAALAFILLGTISTYAADEVADEVPAQETNADVTAPVFDPNIQTSYTVKKEDEEKDFVPEEVFGEITATDDVDGKDVTVSLAYNSVDLTRDGEYQVMYTATDKAGNTSYMILVVTVDGMAPTFDETMEKLYYIDKSGVIYDSKHNVVEALPKTITAKEALGAYKGIGVYITMDEQGNIIFVDMIKDTPADKVFAVNDILVGIDGEDVRGKTPEYVATKIKGEEGTSVQLDVIRDGKKLSVTVERKLIKLHGEVDITAEPNIDIYTINKDSQGTIEITYTATDEAGNTAEFVITVIVMDEEETDKVVENENGKESEDLYNVTTSGNPPEGINLNIDEVEKADSKETEKVDEDKEEETVEENKSTELQEVKDSNEIVEE